MQAAPYNFVREIDAPSKTPPAGLSVTTSDVSSMGQCPSKPMFYIVVPIVLRKPIPFPPKNHWGVLPNELVTIIFQFAVREEPERPVNLVLSATCRHWRGVALASPQLWCQLRFKEPETDYLWTRECIFRSKNRDLELVVSPAVSSTTHDKLSTILDILRPHYVRWKHISFQIDLTLIARFLHRLARFTEAPNLEAMTVSSASEPDSTIPYTLSLHFPSESSGPETQSIQIGPPPILFGDGGFSNLTRLRFNDHWTRLSNQGSVDHFTDALARLTHLEGLILSGSGPFLPIEYLNTVTRRITFPSLRMLEIASQTSTEQVAFYVRLIHAPHLKSLVLAEWRDVEFDSVIPLFGEETTGYHTVTELVISGIDTNAITRGVDAFADLFRGLPRVSHLTVQLRGMNPFAFVSLVDAETQIVFPDLDTIRISGPHRHCISKLVNARYDHKRPIRNLVLAKMDQDASSDFLDLLRMKVLGEVLLLDPDEDDDESCCSDSDDEGEGEDEDEDDWEDEDEDEKDKKYPDWD